MLQTEVKRFFRHPGVDPLAIVRAAWQIATHGRIVSGSSNARALVRLPSRGQPTGGPRIIFPPANAVLEAPQGEKLSREAAGGIRPYHRSVNGVPLPDPPPGIEAGWLPDGPGFASLSLTDAAQNTVHEILRVQ